MKDFGTSSSGNKQGFLIGGLTLEQANAMLRNMEPEHIVAWVLQHSERPILTTNFGPLSASLLHATTEVKPDIDVVWCDTGYNTPHTYRFAHEMISSLSLNMHIYTPKTTSGFRDAQMGIPQVDTEEHKHFTEEVKLEPFKRALKAHQPDLWLTNLRKDQNEFRSQLNILHLSKEGILKVSPFFYFSELEVELYLERHSLPNEPKYFDPTKVLTKRECGLHIA